MYHRPSQLKGAERGCIDAAEHHSSDCPDQQRADERRQVPPQRRQRGQQQESDRHGAGDPDVGVQGTHEIESKAQEDTGHHTHHNRHRHRLHRTPYPSGGAQHEHQQSSRIERAYNFGKVQVCQRGADEHGARDRPKKCQRLPVQPAEEDTDQPVDEENAEYPRGQLRFG